MTIEQIRSYLGVDEETFNLAIKNLQDKEPNIISGGYAFESYFCGKIVLKTDSLQSHLQEDSFIQSGVLVSISFGIKKIQIYHDSDNVNAQEYYYRTTETNLFPLSFGKIALSKMVTSNNTLLSIRAFATPAVVGNKNNVTWSDYNKINIPALSDKVESKAISTGGELNSNNDLGDANKTACRVADVLHFLGDETQKRAIVKGLELGFVEGKPHNFDANSLVENSVFYFRVIDVSLSNMPDIGYWRLEHYVQGDVYFQKATLDYFCFEYVRYKYRHDNSAWATWKLIAQDQAPVNTHLADANSANPVKHTTQAEKNTWNGKATIKGLESVNGVEQNPSIADNANNVNFNSIYYINVYNNKLNYPANNGGAGLLKTMQVYNKTSFFQEFQSIWNGSTWYRTNEGGWQPWKLISAPKMFATGYIDSVTFSGITGISKSVLFDDGVTRNVIFSKTAAYLYIADIPGETVICITGTGIIHGNSGVFSVMYIGGNPVTFRNENNMTIYDILITIKL
jgi:hypothetical protein